MVSCMKNAVFNRACSKQLNFELQLLQLQGNLISRDNFVITAQPHIVYEFRGLPPKFEHIFVAVITSPPFFCAGTFITSLLLIVCGLR